MVVSACKHEHRVKKGTNRKGQQRWKCTVCGESFVGDHDRPLGDMRIDLDKACLAIKMLLEGMGIRPCSRITGLKPDTICDLVLIAGENCDRFLREAVQGVHAEFIELDEIWDFVGAKQKTVEAKNLQDSGWGDVWTWLAMDADTKLILSHSVGDRDESTCRYFLKRLAGSTVGKTQVTSDGLRLYTHNVPLHMGSRCSFAQLVKSYTSSQSETRYSPATIESVEKFERFGNPDMDRCSTSYAERLNLTVRMHVRRFTRLTNGHSKSPRHHAAMVSLFVAWYNWCRKHETLNKQAPAMAAGLADRVWSIRELLENAANA